MSKDTQGGFSSYSLDHVALGLLMPGPRHGYDLYREFTEQFHLIWKAGQARFYGMLNQLQADGLLDVTIEPQEGRPPRKVYHLTGAGRSAFLDWLHEPVQSMRGVRVELIAKLRFFNLLRLPGAEQLIDRQIGIFQAMLDEWERDESRSSDPFFDVVREFRIRQAHFLIDWLADCRERITTPS